MDAREYYGSHTLSAGDIPAGGVEFTIQDVVEFESDQDGKERTRLALVLEGSKKVLVVNRTNMDTISEVAGYETDAWPGFRIKLRVKKVDFGNKKTDGIRITEVTAPTKTKQGGA